MTFRLRSGAVQNLYYYMAGGEKKLLQKNLLAPYEIIAKKQLPSHLFP